MLEAIMKCFKGTVQLKVLPNNHIYKPGAGSEMDAWPSLPCEEAAQGSGRAGHGGAEP